jgi:FKBP-type peptidyl-prolyl cis-trans isomerase SlyD
MKITRNTVVSIRYALSAAAGAVLDAEDAFAYLHGGYGGVLAALEAALEGKSAGEELTLELPPAEAFGEYDPTLVRVEPRAKVPADVVVGALLNGGLSPTLDGETLQYRVLDVDDHDVVLDANHPYAGRTIIVRCMVLGVRAATREEIETGRIR